MELSGKRVMVTFTALNLAAAMLMGFRLIGEPMYHAVYKFIMDHEAGGLRRLSWLFTSPWTDMLMQYVFMLGLAYIPAYFLICWIPKDRKPLMKLSGEDFIVCTAASIGLGYVLNIAGTFINTWIGSFTGKSMMDMNPAIEIAMDFTPSMLLYACIVGPLMEEVMFRGMLLKRARRFGDRRAVVFTAVAFGLMHGNIAQFMYATAIGLIFGYVAVKTNSIRYTVAIHMIVNSFSSLVAFGEQVVYEAFGEFFSVLYVIGLLATVAFMIIWAMIILWRFGRHWYRQLTYHNGPPTDNWIFVYLNPGFCVYVVFCLFEFLQYMF